jgi:hypothetical protein
MVRDPRYLSFGTTIQESQKRGFVPSAGLEPAMLKKTNKMVLCGGPELNRRHMVLQVMRYGTTRMPHESFALAAWLRLTSNG